MFEGLVGRPAALRRNARYERVGSLGWWGQVRGANKVFRAGQFFSTSGALQHIRCYSVHGLVAGMLCCARVGYRGCLSGGAGKGGSVFGWAGVPTMAVLHKVSGCVFSSRFRTSTSHHRSVLATFELLLSLLVSCEGFLLCLARELLSSVVSAVFTYLLSQ
jgi:hypothetical protein